MSALLREVLPLALGAAISPTVLAVSVLTLTAARRPRLRAACFTAGVLAVLVALTALGLTVMAHATDRPSPQQRAISDGVDLAFGLVLLALALGSVVRRPAPGSDAEPAPTAAPAEHRHALVTSLLVGMTVMATNVTTIVLYLPAMKDVARSDAAATDKALVVLLAIVIVSVAAWLPLTLCLVAPEASRRALTGLNAAIQRHHRVIILIVEAAFGVYLVVKGLAV